MWVTLLVTSTAAYFGGLKPGQQCTGQNLVVLTNIGLGITKSQNVVFRGPETCAPSKRIIFHKEIRFSRSREREYAKTINLSPLGSQKLKLLPILLFVHPKLS